MSLLLQLSSLALRPVMGGVAKVILRGVEFKYTDETARAIEDYLVSRFTDPSKQIQTALSRAADRSWQAIDIALGGESFWTRLTDRGEDKAFRADIRTFLDSNPLQLPQDRYEAFRLDALEQLRKARKAGVIPGTDSSPQMVAKKTTNFLRFADLRAVCEAEWRVIGEVADSIREHGYRDLADLIEYRPVPDQPPLLAIAVRFFFRREVETKPQLFQGLMYERVDQLSQVLEAGLVRLLDTFQNHGERLQQILDVTDAIRADVLDMKAEQSRQGERQRELYFAVSGLGEKLQHLHERMLRETDSITIRSDAERQLVQAIKAKFRALPEAQRREMPALLNAIGKLEMAAGNYEEAHQDFRQVASIVTEKVGKAAAHQNSFLASVEKKDWITALNELLEASRLDPERYALFPLDRFEPERILGAGGFGVVFLCHNRLSKAQIVVKALRVEELDRDPSVVLAEAIAMEQLNHESIIRLRDCGYADVKQTRPYLVMDYFDGVALDAYIRKHGSLPLQEAKVLARQLAEGLKAAHEQKILHRDVKPANVLIQHKADGLRSKLIDFGLAIRQETAHNVAKNANSMSESIRGQKIIGTLDYAAPEQVGQLPGVNESPRSDVYGFGRTLCFTIFGTPKPGPRHWKELDDEKLAELIGECIEENPDKRPEGFAAVLDRLASCNSSEPDKTSPNLPRKTLGEETITGRTITGTIDAPVGDSGFQGEVHSEEFCLASPIANKVVNLPSGLPIEIQEERTITRREITGTMIATLERFGLYGYVLSVGFSPDGRLLAAATTEHEVGVWSVVDRRLLRILDGHGKAVRHVGFSPNGELLATGSDDNTACLWSVVDGKPRNILRGHKKGVNSVAFSPDNRQVATASKDKTIRLWSVPDGRFLASFSGHDDVVYRVAFSLDGRLLASSSRDKTVRIWSVPDGRLLTILKGHAGAVIGVAFSPNGEFLATGSDDKTARLWSVSDFRPLANLQGHKNFVIDVVFSPDNLLLATGSGDKTVGLWSVLDGRLITTLPEQEGIVFGIAFSPDGRLIATGTGAGSESDDESDDDEVDDEVVTMKLRLWSVYADSSQPENLNSSPYTSRSQREDAPVDDELEEKLWTLGASVFIRNGPDAEIKLNDESVDHLDAIFENCRNLIVSGRIGTIEISGIEKEWKDCHIEHLTRLQLPIHTLIVRHCELLTSRSIRHIAMFNTLKRIDFSGWSPKKVDEDSFISAIRSLMRLPNLESIRLPLGPVLSGRRSESLVAKFNESLPNVFIN